MSTKFNKKRSGKLTNLSSILHKILEKQDNPLSDQFLRCKLWYHWKEIMGEAIAQKTLPVGYDNGVLYVWTQNSTWMHHLLFMREDMIHAINSKLGKKFVRMIRLTLDRHEVPNVNDKEWQQQIDSFVKEFEND